MLDFTLLQWHWHCVGQRAFATVIFQLLRTHMKYELDFGVVLVCGFRLYFIESFSIIII